MIGGLKRKAVFGTLAVLDAVLLGSVVTLARHILKKKAHEEVVDAIIKENEASTINTDAYRVGDMMNGSENMMEWESNGWRPM